MRHIVFAQGSGFYGCGFFTVDLELNTIKKILIERGGGVPIWREGSDGVRLQYLPDTDVTITPWEGEAQPKPIVLADTGHAEIDLHVLNHLCQLFKTYAEKAAAIWAAKYGERTPDDQLRLEKRTPTSW
jgi:hypothetical protein